MFSPILATNAARFSSNCACNASIVVPLFSAAKSATSFAKPKKPASLATKSVSQFISTNTPKPFSTRARITPSAATRPAFLAALA